MSIYTVTQVNSYIKNMFLQDFMLNHIYVKGEVSNCKYHTSGHIYFTVKDSGGSIAAVMFAGNRKGLKFTMQEGQKVIILGSISVYERDGKYQLYAKEIKLDGTGDLYAKYEQLKKELEEMGMFDSSYKQPIPAYAQKIGIVTAKTGAAIKDIIHIANRRNPYVQLYLYSATVQGEGAAVSIVNAIHCLDQMNLDVLIVGRGGGSIEDLWAFNEEIVARAIFECETPVISAVGHETDYTIADFVADLRAPTPSAAAELAVFELSAYEERIRETIYHLNAREERCIKRAREQLEQRKLRLKYLNPRHQIATKREYVSNMAIQLEEQMKRHLLQKRHELEICSEKLHGLSPLQKLKNGFAYVTDEKGNTIKKTKQLQEDDTLNIQFADGKVKAAVTKIYKNPK